MGFWFTYLAPLEDFTIIKLKCENSNRVQLNWPSPEFGLKVAISPKLPPSPFTMACYQSRVVTHLHKHNHFPVTFTVILSHTHTSSCPIYSPSLRRTESLSLENPLHKFPPAEDWMVCSACLPTKHTPKPQMLRHSESFVDYFPDITQVPKF